MSTYDLILKRRTIRRFAQREIKLEILLKMVNASRLAPSGANMQRQ
jgi:nitroreductase